MKPFRFASLLIAFGALASLGTSAHALDEKGAKLVTGKYLRNQTNTELSASPTHQIITDLDGDGRSDIVLQWEAMGPTFSYPKLSVFIDQGKTYRVVTTDLSGQIEKVHVKGSVISIDYLMPGPKDPRCCPTLKRQMRLQWAQGKLVKMK